MKYTLSIASVSVLALFFGSALIAFALSPIPDIYPDKNIESFRSYVEIPQPSIKVPTVVEIPFDGVSLERSDFTVWNKSTDNFEPYYLKQAVTTNAVPITVETTPRTDARKLIDGNYSTSVDFFLAGEGENSALIEISGQREFTSSSFTLLLAQHVSLPQTIKIEALANGQMRTVRAEERMTSYTVHFPQTTSSSWIITLTYGQPLRISEINLEQDSAVKKSSQAVRFLAQPGENYRIYFDADRFVRADVGEAGNLTSSEDVLLLRRPQTQINPAYVISDIDRDSVPDIVDNCIREENPLQEDIDGNGRGDACDDFDRDGLNSVEDNCPSLPNRNQNDVDGDGIGDVCDDQESRITERYPWIPWVGIGAAALVLIVLMILMVIAKPKETTPEA